MTPRPACGNRSARTRPHIASAGDATIGPCGDSDPGDLRDRIDPTVVALIHTDYVALDGGPHVTPDGVERLEADLITLHRREGTR